MMTVTGDSTDVTTYFVLRLAADGTEATGLTITNFDLQYVRSGAAPSTKQDATALAATDSAHSDNTAIEIDATDQPGLYRVDWPDAAFASGVKEVILSVKCATCFTEHLRVMIDAPVNVTKGAGTAWASGAITAAVIATGAIDADAIADNAIDAGAIATGAITAAKFAAGAIDAAAIANGAIDAATFAADVDAEILSYLVDDATRIDASALNTASTAVGSNGSGLTEAGGTGDHLTAVPWNAAWDAEVQSEVDDALVVQRLDELLNADSDIDGAAPPTVGSVFHELLSKTAGSFTFDQTTDSLEAIRDKEADIETDTQDIQSRLPTALGANGNIKADVRDYSGTAGTFSGGRPEVNTTRIDGAAWASHAAGAVPIDWGAIQNPTASVDLSGTIVGIVTLTNSVAGFLSDAITYDSFADHSGVFIRVNTAQACGATSITLDASANSTTDFYKGRRVVILNGPRAGDTQFITAYNGTTKVATVSPGWVTTPAGTPDFGILQDARADLGFIKGTASAGVAGYVAPDWSAINAPTTTVNLSGTTVKTATDVETDTADIQSRLPAALVSGRIDASVGAMAANTLTASALAADAVAEIQSGLSTLTQAQVQTECEEALQTYHLDHLIAVADPGSVVADSSFLAKLVSKSATPAFSSFNNTTDSLEALRDRGDAAWTTATGFSTLDAAGVRTAVGLASANLDTQLSAIDDYLDTEIAAIKAVTDLFTAAQSEPSSVPAANATPMQKIAWLAALARNKITQTSTTQLLKADDGSTTVGTSTLSDDGTTFTRGEWS